ncbi:MAG: hypothetical protein ABIY55_14700 [Kofleriaceae bacterium]
MGALALVAAMGCTSTERMLDLDFTVMSGSVDADIHARVQIAADGTTAIMRQGDPDEAMVLPAGEMSELRDMIDAADFSSLDDHYDSDAFVDLYYVTTVRFENGSYTVMSNDSSDAPDALQKLDRTLTDIARN